MTKSLAAQLMEEKRKRQELETQLRRIKFELNEIKENYKTEMYERTLFDLQYAQDAMLIAAHKVLGLGKKRCTELGKSFNAEIHNISELIFTDAKDDKDAEYARNCVDRQLAEIFGDEAETWDVRYDMKRMRGG